MPFVSPYTSLKWCLSMSVRKLCYNTIKRSVCGECDVNRILVGLRDPRCFPRAAMSVIFHGKKGRVQIRCRYHGVPIDRFLAPNHFSDREKSWVLYLSRSEFNHIAVIIFNFQNRCGHCAKLSKKRKNNKNSNNYASYTIGHNGSCIAFSAVAIMVKNGWNVRLQGATAQAGHETWYR